MKRKNKKVPGMMSCRGAMLALLVQILFITMSRAQCGPVISTFPYSEGFEAAAAWTAGGTNSDWAWGAPTHPLINAAGGGAKCWCVGGLSGTNYLSSEQSWIMSPCFNFSGLNYPWISFKIFWECERQWDGMTFQYSLNGGATWTNVGAFGDPVDCMNQNWFNYNSITYLNSIAVRHGWSGRVGPTVSSCVGGSGSGGWVTAKHCLSNLANQPNVRFRFLFGSGTTCNSYDGMAVDDIFIDNAPPVVANFSTVCGTGNTVNFTNTSSSCPNSFSWNFGDPGSGGANTSTLQNPSHTFSAPGTYTVTLTSSGPCNASGSVSIPVTVLGATVSVTPVICNGAGNGSAAVTSVTGSSGPYTYAWLPSGGTGPTATGLLPGNYTVNVTAPGGCPASTTFSITQPAVLTASNTHTNVYCNGGSNGSATVTASGGTGPYTYNWAPSGGTGATATGLSATTYTCTVTDAHGCTFLSTVTITQPPALNTTSTQTNILCNGGTGGSATVTASGGTSPYVYAWSSGGTGTTASGLGAGNYTCTVTDARGCTTTASIAITQPAALAATTTQTDLSCNGNCNGSATVTISGGTPAYTYLWSSGVTNPSILGACAGTYTCTITDAHNCTLTETFTITQPTTLTATSTSTNITCNGAADGTASVTPSGGTTPYTYAWTPSGGTGATASGLSATAYTCTITDANNCTVTQTFNITEPSPLTVTAAQTDVSCNGGNTGSATVTPSGGTGPYQYAWLPSGGTNPTAHGLMAGTYTCTVTDANSCTVTQTFMITEPALLSVTTSQTDVTCNGGNNGSASVTVSGGVLPYTYSWSPSGGNTATASGLMAGPYTCLITDANGCTLNPSFVINDGTSPAVSLASATDVTCFGAADGTASVTITGGTAPLGIQWTPSGGTAASATGLGPATYTCTVTDANGCAATATASITEPPQLVVSSFSQTDVPCFGGATGSASVTVSGGTPGYSYTWLPSGGSGATASALTAGSYTVTVTDTHNCSVTQTYTITEPPQLTLSLTSTDVTCFGACNGQLSATAGGGTPSYSYAWSSGCTTASCANVCAGNYSLTLTDANGCTATATATITEPPQLTASVVSTNEICFGQTNGTVSVSASGGSPAYTYTWLPNVSTSAAAYNLAAANYQVTVADVNGCTAVVQAAVTQPPQLTLAASATPNSICTGMSVQLNANAAGGTPAWNIVWTPGNLSGGTQTLSPLTNTTYTATVTDGNGCTATATVPVTVNPTPVAAFAGDVLAGCGPLCVNFADASTAAPGVITAWNWNFGDGNSSTQQLPSHCYNGGGLYTVSLSITTADGCSATVTMPNYIEVLQNPTAAFGATPQTATILNPTIQFSDSSVNAISWSWSFGDLAGSSSTQQNPMFTYTDPTCYDVVLTVSSVDGCIDTVKHSVCISPDAAVYVPNTFTPDGDGLNDVFMPVGVGLLGEGYHLMIFDRWGNMIFESRDLYTGWDGRVHGHSDVCPIDTYVWKLTVQDITGKTYNLIGRMNLMK